MAPVTGGSTAPDTRTRVMRRTSSLVRGARTRLGRAALVAVLALLAAGAAPGTAPATRAGTPILGRLPQNPHRRYTGLPGYTHPSRLPGPHPPGDGEKIFPAGVQR